MRDRLALSLAVAALLLAALQGQWQGWARRREVEGLRQRIEFLTAELSHVQRLALPADRDEPPEDPNRLADALRRLGSDDLLRRYQAGLAVREFGDEAVPALLDLANGDDRKSRESALLLLAQLDATPILPALRDMARKALAGEQSKVPLRETELASLIAILARHADAESLPLFQTALAAEPEAVRAAALLGARRVPAVELVPALAARLGNERQALGRQVEQTLCLICREHPEAFREELAKLPPRTRYEVSRALVADPAASVRETLRQLSRDPDQRVALGAARILATKNDPQARPALERILDSETEKEIRDLAEGLVRRLDSPDESVPRQPSRPPRGAKEAP